MKEGQLIIFISLALIFLVLILSSCVKTEGLPEERAKNQNSTQNSQTPTQVANDTPQNPQKPALVSVSPPGEIESQNVSYLKENDSPQKNTNTQNPPTESELSEPAKESDATTEPATEAPKTHTRIDVTTHSSGGADVTAEIDGITKSFTVADNDPDAVVFDIGQNLGKGIREIRAFVFINGIGYLKPSEQRKALEKIGQKEASAFDPTTIPIMATKEDGFIRGVGCDLQNKYIRIDLTNPTDTTITIFKNKNTFPKVKSSLALFLNRRPLIDTSCTGGVYSFVPEDNFTCVRANAIFIAAGSRNLFETNASYDLNQPDIVNANRPGYKETIEFHCKDPDKGSESINTTSQG